MWPNAPFDDEDNMPHNQRFDRHIVPLRGRPNNDEPSNPMKGQQFSEDELDAVAPLTEAELAAIANRHLDSPPKKAQAKLEARIQAAWQIKYGRRVE